MFSTADRILIRWAGGHVAVGTSGKEQYLELKGVNSAKDAREIGEEALAVHAAARGTTTPSGHVHDASQQPMGGFRLGDTMDGDRIQSISITMDAEANTVATPELGDQAALLLEQFDRRIARANAGVTSEYASPFPRPAERGDRIDTTPPSFTYTAWQQGSPE